MIDSSHIESRTIILCVRILVSGTSVEQIIARFRRHIQSYVGVVIYVYMWIVTRLLYINQATNIPMFGWRYFDKFGTIMS